MAASTTTKVASNTGGRRVRGKAPLNGAIVEHSVLDGVFERLVFGLSTPEVWLVEYGTVTVNVRKDNGRHYPLLELQLEHITPKRGSRITFHYRATVRSGLECHVGRSVQGTISMRKSGRKPLGTLSAV
jgi:hypothetical protein